MVRVIGNSKQQQRTIQATMSSTVTVLSGPRHVGKRTFLKSIASSESHGDGDFMTAGGSVGDARRVSSFLKSMPLTQAQRLVVVDCYDGISEAAQDAYLKPCEELPSTASIVFLIQDEMHFLAPLASRIKNVIRWSPLSSTEMKEFFDYVGESDPVVMEACGGLPGLYDTVSQSNVSEILDFVLSERPSLKPVPSFVKSIPSGRSYARDALCHVLNVAAMRMVSDGDVSRAHATLSLASTLDRIPSTNADIHWRHVWSVFGVT